MLIGAKYLNSWASSHLITKRMYTPVSYAQPYQREELNPLEQARTYQPRINQFGWSIEQLAKTVNKNPRTLVGV